MRRAPVVLALLAAASVAVAQTATPDLSARKPPQARALPTPTAAPRDAGPTEVALPARDRAYGALQRGLYLTALQLALPLARLGDPVAQTLIGEIYVRGLGVPRSDAEAARWFGAASASGNPDGEFRYALMLLDGSAGRTDPAEARRLMQAAADAGIPLAAYNFGQMLIEEQPVAGFKAALPYFRKAADAGVSDGQYAMAQIYAYGRGVGQPDPALARRYLSAASRGGNPTAQVEFGIWLINGKGGPKNLSAGVGWLRRAAARGNPIAMNRLAHLYKDGIGVEASKVEAGKWSVLAKRAGNDDGSLDDFFRKLDADAKKAALEAANTFRPS